MYNNYDSNFYRARQDSLISAKKIVPIILEFYKPKSVVDIGCGTGAFLKIFKDNGSNEILGLDGGWMKDENLLIDKSK